MNLRRILLLSAIAVGVLSPVGIAGAAGAANTVHRPILGIAKGTTTVNLNTGAGTTVNLGYFLGIGLFLGSSKSTFSYTSATAFSATGTGTLLTANGNELFFTSSGTGTLTGTDVAATTVDTITGGTGRFKGAIGVIKITAKGTSATTVGSTETFTTFGLWTGSISYPVVGPVVGLSDLAGSLTGTLSSTFAGNGCSFIGTTFNATYPGSSAVGNVTLRIDGCVPLDFPPTTTPFAGTFTLTTNVGTLSGTAAGSITNVLLPPSDIEAATAALTLSATSGTGDFAVTTGTLNVGLNWPTPGSLSFVGTIAPR
jgi:fibronectin-binding autotransporter adhesin